MLDENFMSRVLVGLNDIQMELKAVKEENRQLKESINSLTKMDFSERRWCDDMWDKADRVGSRRGENGKKVLSDLYIQLRNVYGFVVDDERQKWKIRYNVEKAPSTLVLVYHSDFRRIFENLLSGEWDKVKPKELCEPSAPIVEEVEEPVVEEKEPTQGAKMESIRNRIDEMRSTMGNFKTVGRGSVSEIIFDRMNVSWKTLTTRYNNAHGRDKYKPVPRMRLVSNSPVAYKEFLKVCKAIEKEMENQNENNI